MVIRLYISNNQGHIKFILDYEDTQPQCKLY